jgi:two-component system response regulator RegA
MTPPPHTEATDALHAVLVVDDDDIFRNRLCRAFASRGWSATGAADGTAAIELAARNAPDLAVVDLRLPGMGGLEIVRALRDLDETTCIIMLTGYGSIATALAATRLGASHFLTKPADAEQILAVWRRLSEGTDDPAASEDGDPQVPSLARVEWEHIQRVLSDCDGNVSQAAKLLGLHRRSLQRKLMKYPPRV